MGHCSHRKQSIGRRHQLPTPHCIMHTPKFLRRFLALLFSSFFLLNLSSSCSDQLLFLPSPQFFSQEQVFCPFCALPLLVQRQYHSVVEATRAPNRLKLGSFHHRQNLCLHLANVSALHSCQRDIFP